MREGVDLTIVGPKPPRERGGANLFYTRGRPIVGPSQESAALRRTKAAIAAAYGAMIEFERMQFRKDIGQEFFH